MITCAAVNDFIAQKYASRRRLPQRDRVREQCVQRASAKRLSRDSHSPKEESIEGVRCYPRLCAVPQKMDRVLSVVPSAQAEQVVRDADAAGVRRVWMQPGAESEAAIASCREHQISVVHGECILMCSEPAQFLPRAHRFVKGMPGQLPK